MPNGLDTKSIEGMALMAYIDSCIEDKARVMVEDRFTTLQREREQHLVVYYGAKKDIEAEFASVQEQFLALDARFIALEKLIRSAVPDGDTHGHCRVHEGHIKDAKERDEMIAVAKKKAIDLGTGGVVLLIAYAVWDYIKLHLGGKP